LNKRSLEHGKVFLINIEQAVPRTLNKWLSKECWTIQQITHLRR